MTKIGHNFGHPMTVFDTKCYRHKKKRVPDFKEFAVLCKLTENDHLLKR